MKYITFAVLTFLLMFCQNASFAEMPKDSKTEITTSNVTSEQLNNELETLENKVGEIKRDQINYKIENDLIREIYSTNYKTINIVITTILGIFGFLGFFGLRDLHSLNQKYKVELEAFSARKKELDLELCKVKEEQKDTKESFESIIKTNEEQNRKIKILEIREKISSLIKSKIYIPALEYCAVALEIDPISIPIMHKKALIQYKLGRFSESIDTYNDILELDKKDQTATVNLCELYLFNRDIDNYEKSIKKSGEIVKDKNGDFDIDYFEILKLYIEGKNEEVDNEIQALLSNYGDKDKAQINWNFAEFRLFLREQPDTSIRKKLVLLVSFLSGSIDKEEVLSRLKKG